MSDLICISVIHVAYFLVLVRAGKAIACDHIKEMPQQRVFCG